MGTCSQDYRCWFEAHLFRGGTCIHGSKVTGKEKSAGSRSQLRKPSPLVPRQATRQMLNWRITGGMFRATEGHLETTLRNKPWVDGGILFHVVLRKGFQIWVEVICDPPEYGFSRVKRQKPDACGFMEGIPDLKNCVHAVNLPGNIQHS